MIIKVNKKWSYDVALTWWCFTLKTLMFELKTNDSSTTYNNSYTK